MNESVLQALMRLFAMVASVDEEGYAHNERDVVVEYLQRQFSNELVNRIKPSIRSLTWQNERV